MSFDEDDCEWLWNHVVQWLVSESDLQTPDLKGMNNGMNLFMEMTMRWIVDSLMNV